MEPIIYIVISIGLFFLSIFSMLILIKYCSQREQIVYVIDPEVLRSQLDDIEFVDEFEVYKDSNENVQNNEKAEL